MSKETLEAALKAFGGNRTKLAESIGASRQQVQQWLRTGWGAPSWWTEKLAKVAKRK